MIYGGKLVSFDLWKCEELTPHLSNSQEDNYEGDPSPLTGSGS
jgi:hypothetical protein